MPRDATTFHVRYLPPFDWDYLLTHLAGRLLPGVDALVDGKYARTVDIDGDLGTVTVADRPKTNRLAVTVTGDARRHAAAVAGHVRLMFDTERHPAAIKSVLGPDPWVGPLLAALPGVRVPGGWSAFETLCRTVVGQQVSVKGATTIMGRLAARLGRPVPETGGVTVPGPEAVAAGDLHGLGMPGKRAESLRNLARLIASGTVPLPELGANPAAVRESLRGLPGIGPWTIEYFALRGLRDPDAWPGSDLVLKRVVDTHPLKPKKGDASEAWRPYRAYAAVLLWWDVARRRAEAQANPV